MTLPTLSRFARCSVIALSRPLGALAALALTGALLVSPSARAQVTEIEPYYVIVTGENANLRCGAGSVWYTVRQLEEGDMLRVDGHEAGWLRVHYPRGTRAMVRADEVRFDEDRGMVVLTRRSRLYANNPLGGVSESWRTLLEEELRPGTELEHVETVRDFSGSAAGFRVIAPTGSKGYINELFVRRATEQEVRERLGAPEPAPDEAVVVEETAVAEEPAGESVAPEPVEATEPIVEEEEWVAPPVAEPEPEPAPAPETRPVERAPIVLPVAPESQPATPREAEVVDRGAPPTLEQLNAAYDEVMRAPIEEAEFGTLIGEYERLRDGLPEDETGDRTRSYIGLKLEVLSIRRELQDSLRQMEETERLAERGAGRIREMGSELDARPRYTIVGRLGASTVYDGRRLPLMYRVQSVEGSMGRTIAYVIPSPEVDLRPHLGAIVGIVGEERVDTALQMPIIRPKRVDALGADRR